MPHTNNTVENTVHELFFNRWWIRLDKNGNTRTVRKTDTFLIDRAINKSDFNVFCKKLIDMLANQDCSIIKDSDAVYSYQSGLIATLSDMIKRSPHCWRLVDYAIQSAFANRKPFKALYLLIQRCADPSHEKELSTLLNRKFEVVQLTLTV